MTNQFPTPPVEMVMPQTANQIFTVANLAILAIFAIVLGRECVRSRSPLPILFLLGGMLGVFTEPFFDLMVCAWYPQVNSELSVVHAFNVAVPIWLIAPWGFYIGGQAYYVAPGHTLTFHSDCEALEFTPTDALERTLEAARRNLAADAPPHP